MLLLQSPGWWDCLLSHCQNQPRTHTCEYIRVLTRLALVSCLAGCSFAGKQARLSPLAAAEHRLARAEKIRSDPSERAGEILSVTRTALQEVRGSQPGTAGQALQSRGCGFSWRTPGTHPKSRTSRGHNSAEPPDRGNLLTQTGIEGEW